MNLLQDPRPIVYPRDQHPISRALIDTDALKIMYRLLRHGYKAFLVGGGVRDLLLGKQPKDFDIATDARPQQVRDLFRNSRIIGRRFKLVHVFFRGGKVIEVSTFRDNQPEGETEPTTETGEVVAPPTANQRPTHRQDNVYGNEISDALRRDLTINGLYYDLATFSIIDYVGGVRDLGDGVIRVIGDPLLRFKEDPVRMLRAVRHAARNGFHLEEQCEQVLREHASLLAEASPVRVYDEIRKDLTFGELLATLRLLFGTGLLAILLPGIQERHLAHGTSMGAALERLDAMQRNGHEIQVSTILSAIALGWAAAEHGVEVEVALRDYGELRDITQKVFQPLSVPRRDVDQIHCLLRAWKRCFTEKRRGISLPTGELLREFKILLEAFACELPAPPPKRSSAGAGRRSGALKREDINQSGDRSRE